MKVIIIGGGIIGSSVAYYLAKRGVSAIVIERCGVACAASGRAGGFLAKNWSDGGELGPLSQKSFELHMQLAEEFPDCGYRRLDTYSINAKQDAHKLKNICQKLPDWVDGPVTAFSQMGDTNTTAQVTPGLLAKAFLDTAKKLCGTEVIIGVADSLEMDENKKVIGVKVGDSLISADIVIIAMGPWSGSAVQWGIRVPRIQGRRAHSIILQPSVPGIGAHGLFVDYSPKSSSDISCEVYPRANGEVFVCGMSDHVSLPEKPEDVTTKDSASQGLETIARAVSSHLQEATVLLRQACFLPTSPDGLPVIGKIPDSEGIYIASGHSCWGILNAPATGFALAELIVTGRCEFLDLTPFDPARFW